MGAGSAKGRPQHDDDDRDDKFSRASSDKWGNEDDSSDEEPATNQDDKEDTPPELDPEPNAEEDDKDRRDKKRFNLFKRNNNNEDRDKVGDFVADENNEDDDDKKNKGKKGDKNKGFKLFGWRSKKNEEQEKELDKDIDDLEKTFDSLGIVGKNNWRDENESKHQRKETADDLELLEPMRKRKNVRVRGTKGMNGTIAGGNHDSTRPEASSNGSSSSKRTFRYSWETEKKKKTTKKEDDDEWEYKAVVIEGFDIDKFRKANQQESVFDSTSLPNAVSGEDQGMKQTLRYDQNEQQILASIERDFMYN